MGSLGSEQIEDFFCVTYVIIILYIVIILHLLFKL